ncbi:MAG TPA: protein kinase [Tabrizicola sp.]|nr:protein kinase [Tabrizicola sp.]
MAQQKAVEAQADNLEDIVDELPPGTKLLRGQYTIVRYLNSGGFGITYLAKDSLDRNVVIKECFPSSFCRRSKTVVAARSRAHTAELRSVVQLFVREARNLAKIVHPNIVAVHQVFEDNFTAYMAIDFIDGLDLQEVIEGQGTKPTASEIVVITEKLLAAVGFIHAHDMLHRDISPDNVLIDKSGEPILIDFGAARDEASQKNRAMSALRVVKDGYSPQEFYIAGSDQGPWSDLYALGATLYHLITGEAPTNGQARLAALAEGRPDPYLALDGRVAGYPPGFLAAIDKAMSTLPGQRVQSANEWLAMFAGSAPAPDPAKGQSVEGAVRALLAEPGPVVMAEPARKPEPVAAVVPRPVEVIDAAVEAPFADDDDLAGEETVAASQTTTAPPDFIAMAASKQPAPSAPTGRSGGPMIAVGAILLIAALGGGYFMMGGNETPAPESTATAPEEATPETTAAEPTAAEASTTAATAAPAAEAAPVETASAPAESTATPAAEDPAPEATAEAATAAEAAPADTAVVETATAPDASALTAPTGTLSANQIGFAAWDASIPFTEESRIVGGKPVSVVARILPTTDRAEAGTWLEPGLLLYTINGVDIQQSGSVTSAVLNAMKVDPDGKARLVVEYAGESLDRESGLLTVKVTRLLSLSNGVNLSVSVVGDKWETVVTGITAPEKTELRQGDILFRDKTTGIAIDGSDSVEVVLAKLLEAETGLTSFSIIRDNKVTSAAMQLAVEP